MTDHRLQVKDVADRLGVSTPTIRRYSDRYAEHLSSYANQRPRTFTEQDVARLSTAVRMTALRESMENVSEVIRDLQAGAIDDDAEASDMVPVVRGDDLPTVTLATVESMVQDVVRTEMRSQRMISNAMITGVIIGMIATMVFVAVILWIVGAT